MTILGIPFHWRQAFFLLGDAGMALVAVYLGHVARLLGLHANVTLMQILEVTTGASVLFLSLNLLMLYIFDAYNPASDFRRPINLLRVVLAVVASQLVHAALSYLSPWYFAIAGRGAVVLSFMFYAVLVAGWRWVAAYARPIGAARIRTLIVGAGQAGRDMAETLTGSPECRDGYEVVGFLDSAPSAQVLGHAVVGGFESLREVCATLRVRLVVVAIPHDLPDSLTGPLLQAKAGHLEIVDMPTLFKRLTGRVPVAHLRDTWLIFGSGFSGQGKTLTRAIDVALSSVGLTIALIPLLLAAIAVKLTSKGPVLYRQERVGLHNQPFTIYKLRTMRQDAEAETGPVWAQGASDARVTAVGRFLRRSRLDELPQLWNVLIGDMAIVGPRPERPVFVNQFEQKIPFYAMRHAVRPGLTGWAQVSYRYAADQETTVTKLEYELYAIQEMTPALYLLILLKTVQTVLVRPGS